MICLGIESTAHTFGASLVDNNDKILTNVNSTYRPPVGVGIHPRKASEHHATVADGVVRTALLTTDGSVIDPDVIAYAAGPGLGPCLRVGATVGRAISSFLGKPLVPVHHGVAHLDIAMSIAKARDPLAVLVSGGHTSILVHVGRRWRVYGETQDITLGNLLDMFAREAKLPSPGGLSVSLQETAFAMLSEAVERSLVQTRRSEVLLAGGVAASSRLREMIGSVAEDHEASFHPVPVEYSGDCGAQIACSGRLAFNSGITISTSDSFVTPRWRMDEVDVPWIPRT